MEPDPNGEVILEVGEAKLLLQVSVKALASASPVFAVMFGPNFREGADLGAAGTKTVPLPEDDPGAMAQLCNIVHLKHDKVSIGKFRQMEELSYLCHKYDCSEALIPWRSSWLSKWPGSCDGEDNYLSWLSVVYAWNDRKLFHLASLNILRHCRGIDLAWMEISDAGYDILPANLLEDMASLRKELAEDLIEDIHSVIQPPPRAGTALPLRNVKQSSDQDQKYCVKSAKIGSYIMQLSELGLYPRTMNLINASLSETVLRLSNYKAPDRYNPDSQRDAVEVRVKTQAFGDELASLIMQYDNLVWHCTKSPQVDHSLVRLIHTQKAEIDALLREMSEFSTFMGTGRLCFCHWCRLDIGMQIKWVLREREQSMKGLCLSCVKDGRRLPQWGNCEGFAVCEVEQIREEAR